MSELALSFACEGESLIGVLSLPAKMQGDLGVLVLVGGPQYRAGSHRQFTLLARALAAAGYPTMRFDFRGMGDSSGEAPGFEASEADISAAMDAMQAACPQVQRIVLWGLCDGASAALLYDQRSRDVRIAGFALANPWWHTAQGEAHAIVHSYYRQRLLDGAFWRKLATGGINPLRKLGELAANWHRSREEPSVEPASGAGGLSAAIADLQKPTLLLLCKRDATAQRFLAQLELEGCDLLQRPCVKRVDFEEADHTFSCAEWRLAVENVTIEWLSKYSS